MDMKEVVGLIISIAGVIAAFMSWRAAERAAQIAKNSLERTAKDDEFREYERYCLARSESSSELSVFMTHCDRVEARLRQAAVANGGLGGSRYKSMIDSVEYQRELARTCGGVLAAEAASRREKTLSGEELKNDYREARLRIEQSRASMKGELDKLLQLESGLNAG